MKNESPKKTEIFLLLALRRAAQLHSAADDSTENLFAALAEQMSAPEAKKFERLRRDYQNKSEPEKRKWRGQTENYIGSETTFVDENIHRSHIESAMRKEIPAIRQIVLNALPTAQRSHHKNNDDETKNEQTPPASPLEKIVCRAFAKQFVALRDLRAASAFDYLSGAQLARLIRLAGIREVALACMRITAVESVAAFLRRFSAEDARAIAAQLSGLPQAGSERLSFAENLVQAAMEIESKPSAMLDLLGIRLIGILLCGGAEQRIRYAAQKLPLEVAPKLGAIIETQCRQTPAELQREISAEIERLAETAAKTIDKVKN
ncbi:MAG: hypothetical protein ACR2HG_00800 [Pyrinomonadaceae bacterium]